MVTHSTSMRLRYLRSIRLLAECMQQFEKLSDSHIRQFDLTHAQFDIVATLGNTQGMSCKELGEKTLITKGTLTGVLDRLTAKKLIQRVTCDKDKRRSYVRLTPEGEQIFAATFPYVVNMMQPRFNDYDESDFDALDDQLTRLKSRLA